MKNIYYSWWSTNFNDNQNDLHRLSLDKKLLNVAKNSISLLRLVYPKSNINLITDSLGKDFFSNHNLFNNIIIELDSLPKEYKEVWSLGKIKSYEFIASQKEPFLHLDFDVFISAPFPKNFLNSQIFVQGQDYCGDEPYNDPYLSSKFFELVVNKPYFIDKQYSFSEMHNMAIFGGNDTDLVKEYASHTLNMILDPKNSAYFITPSKELSIFNWSKACVAEQYSLGSFLMFKKIFPKRFLLDGFCGHCRLEESLNIYNYVHLPGGLKDLSDEYFLKSINKFNALDFEIKKNNSLQLDNSVWPPRAKR